MYLGMDISKLNFDAALLSGSDARPRHRAFPNTPAGFERVHEWPGGQSVHEWPGGQSVHACLEATGPYGDTLARSLHGRGHPISVVNPAQIKAFGQTGLSRIKTDKADAILIAHYCWMHTPPIWNPPPPEAAELQVLVSRLEALGEMRQMEQNRLDTPPRPSALPSRRCSPCSTSRSRPPARRSRITSTATPRSRASATCWS